MKKSLVALATLAAATGVMAQTAVQRNVTASSVELFGVIDATVTNFKSDGVGNVTRMQGEGRNESSRLGVRGFEDLGGGLGAAFWMEAGLFVDSGAGQNTTSNNTSMGQNGIRTGTNNQVVNADIVSLGATQGITFNRASNVSLISREMGEIRVGRDYVPTFWNKTIFDPFGTVGVGAYTNISYGTLNKYVAVAPPGVPAPQVRTSNSISYFSPNMNGFRGQVMYAFDEQISNCTDITATGASSANTNLAGGLCQGPAGSGKFQGFRLTYDNGPLALAAASGNTNYPQAGFNTTVAPLGSSTAPTTGPTAYAGNYGDMNFAAAYTAGATKFMGQYGVQKMGDTTAAYAAATGVAGNTSNAFNTGAPNLYVITNGASLGTSYASGLLNTTARTLKTTLVGLTHQTGAATLKFSYAVAKVTGGQGSTTVGGSVGNTLAVRNFEDGAKQKQLALGIVYDLSKRSAIYSTYSRLTTTGLNTYSSMGVPTAYSDATGQSKTATGFDIGVRHRF
jgi:predicted porin